MPQVTRLTETADSREGFLVETDAADATYEYELRRKPDTEGVLSVVARRKYPDDGGVQHLDPEATGAVEDAMDDRGYDVA
jgi:hypothetical protein